MTNFRPTALDDFIGQRHILDNLEVMINGAIFRDEAAPHMLFVGPPGLGKTSLARVIASEMGSHMIPLLGSMVKKEADLASVLCQLEEKDVLFIDEIHALPRRVAEVLYTATEDFTLDLLIGSKNQPRPVQISLWPFTLVGATTHPGGISGPLRERFGYVGRMEFYSSEELCEILGLAAYSARIDLSESAARLLAINSRGTPRVALRLFQRARDIAQSRVTNRVIDDVAAEQALRLADVMIDGLDVTDIRYLRALWSGGPEEAPHAKGLSTLAALLAEEESTLEEVVEPYLLRQGLIERRPQGRTITPRGVNLLFEVIDAEETGEWILRDRLSVPEASAAEGGEGASSPPGAAS